MDIKVDSPVKLSLDVTDFDEYIPSMKASVNIEVVGFKYDFSLSTALWFECKVFYEFLGALKRKSTSTLIDMEKGFELKIDFSDGNIAWSISEADLNGGSSSVKGSRPISGDELAGLINAFNSYSKWW
jgi:hypothetical protein